MKSLKKLSNDGIYVLILTIFLTIFGVYMVYSASRVWALAKMNDQFYYLKRQLIFAVLGFALLILGVNINRDYLKKHHKLILIISIISLIMVLIPGIGLVRGGSRSWFGIGSFAIQPAEFFKLAIIIYASKVLEINYDRTNKFIKNVLPIIMICLIGFGLIMLQPDFGTGIVMVAAIVIMCMVTKVPFKIYLRGGILAIAAFGVLIISAPYRLQRITSFINPWEDPLGSGFQIIQSLFAIGPGGLTGNGIDGSIQKHFFLPEPQTDFIFAIICEEFGFIGGSFIIFIFGLLIFKGLNIAKNSNNKFDSFLALGIISLLGVQVLINLGVVVGLLPVTGITLPLISYGGSSLVLMLFSLGVLIGISRKDLLLEEDLQ